MVIPAAKLKDAANTMAPELFVSAQGYPGLLLTISQHGWPSLFIVFNCVGSSIQA
jgi:hypothetical protein